MSKKQKGGMQLKDLPKDLENIIKDYKKQMEKQEKKLKQLKTKIDRKYKRKKKMSKQKFFSGEDQKELIVHEIEIPIYVKYYMLLGGDYSDLLISKDIPNPNDIEEDDDEDFFQDERKIKERAMKAMKKLYGGTKTQKGGMRLKDLPKDLENIITDYKKQMEKYEKVLKPLKKKIKKIKKDIDKKTKSNDDAAALNLTYKLILYVNHYLKHGGNFQDLGLKEFTLENFTDYEDDDDFFTGPAIDRIKEQAQKDFALIGGAKIGGAKKRKTTKKIQKGGMQLKKLPKELEKLIKDYKEEMERQEKKQKELKKKINQKYKKLQKLQNKKDFSIEDETKLMTLDIEIPIYVKYYLLNDGDYSDLDISKDFSNPDDIEDDESDLEPEEIAIKKKVTKLLYGGAKKKKQNRRYKQIGGTGEQTLDDFLAEGIQKMNLNKTEVDDLITGIKNMKSITPQKVMSSFDKILAARGKKGQQRGRGQRGGTKRKPAKKTIKRKSRK